MQILHYDPTETERKQALAYLLDRQILLVRFMDLEQEDIAKELHFA